MKDSKRKKQSLPKDWIVYPQFKRELLQNKKTREAYNADAAERAIRMAIIGKRIEKKLSQAAVAQRAGMQQSAIARLESGNSSPTLETVSRVLHALGAHVKVS